MTYLTRDQVTSLMRRAYRRSAREHAIFLLAYTHGLRVSEVAAITSQSVAGGVLRVARLKGSLATVQPLQTSANYLYDEPSVLSRWLSERPKSENNLFDRLFPLSRRHLERLATEYMLAVGVPRELAHIHSLKHACASHLLREGGATVEYIRTYVGHKDVKNTMVYLNISNEEASAKASEAFAKMS